MLKAAVFKSGLRRYDTVPRPGGPTGSCYYFINDSATPSFVIDVSPRTISASARRWRAIAASSLTTGERCASPRA